MHWLQPISWLIKDTFFFSQHFLSLLLSSCNVPDPWGICQNTDCGEGGLQTRAVKCIQGDLGETADEHCPHNTRPSETRPCFRVCDFHRFQYMWHVGPWSRCLPRDGAASCVDMAGMEKRNVTCVAKCGGRAPSVEICRHFAPEPEAERPCLQKCPRDCITTNYGGWTVCDKCWIRNTTRYREVVSEPLHGGKPCSDLSESRPCPTRPRYCDETGNRDNYQYKLGNWTDCMAYHDHRGQRRIRGFTAVLGHRRRTVDCINNRGKLVDIKRWAED